MEDCVYEEVVQNNGKSDKTLKNLVDMEQQQQQHQQRRQMQRERLLQQHQLQQQQLQQQQRLKTKEKEDQTLEEKFKKICNAIDNCKEDWHHLTKKLLKIKSYPSHLRDMASMISSMVKFLKDLNANVKIVETRRPIQTSNGAFIKPKAIIAEINNGDNYEQLLIYGHIDVKPKSYVSLNSNHETIFENNQSLLYGRGVTFGKGPLLCWLFALKGFQEAGIKPRINIKFIIETMRTENSRGFESIVHKKRKFFTNISYVCMMENPTSSMKYPLICKNSPGRVDYCIELQTPFNVKPDHDARNDLLAEINYITNRLKNLDGTLILTNNKNGDHKQKQPSSPLLATKAFHELPPPIVCLHNLTGFFVGKNHAVCTLSMFLQPRHNTEFFASYVFDRISQLHTEFNSAHTLTSTECTYIESWRLSRSMNPNLLMLKNAIKSYKKVEPILTSSREVCGVVQILKEITRKEILIFSLFTPNECVRETSEEYIEGDTFYDAIKQVSNYLLQFGQVIMLYDARKTFRN